jgi:hypothetical protein
MRTTRPRFFILTVLLIGTCWGCGSGGAAGSLPGLVPVKGKVTFKGKPVTKGVVQFEPDDYGRPASGELQSDGTYVLTTLKTGDGVVPGHHRVTISGTGSHPSKELVPKKYRQPHTSGLTADVSAEKTEFDFDLK